MSDQIPVAERETRPAPTETRRAPKEERPVALFREEESRGFHTRWDGIQTGFIDEPRAAVEQADALVGEMLKKLTDVFAAERTQLEEQWSRGGNVSTEDLRVALKRYRSFFERLLSI
jgi:hypothetical protein